VANADIAEQKLHDKKQSLGESVEDYIYSFEDLCNDFDPRVKKIIRAFLPHYLKKMNPPSSTRFQGHSP
jgi:hypothetical protein